MPTKRLMRTAATASMLSSARTNRAVRKNMTSSQATSAPSAAATPHTDSGLTSQLEELQSLKDRGILTEEEFQAKKRQILGI